ncbi:MAG: DUF1638 domain-containing protein [Planctomycetota bacterium]|nr:DUF1638 domain-containing protein [Planctomycetota bacterium]
MNDIYPHMIKRQEKRYKLIACEIMFREICYLLSQTPKIVNVVFLPKGLHDVGGEMMKATLQAELDQVDPEKYEAILLGYGLCNNGVCGLHAKVRMAIPRAHDCITLLLGSRRRYQDYFDANPGVYYKSSGWIEREDGFMPQNSVVNKLGLNKSHAEYVEEYGEENAQYLMETLGEWPKNYSRMTFIDMSVVKEDGGKVSFGNVDSHRVLAKQKADELGWQYDEIKGDVRLLDKLVNCDWNDDEFLIIPPERRIISTHTDEIVSFQ